MWFFKFQTDHHEFDQTHIFLEDGKVALEVKPVGCSEEAGGEKVALVDISARYHALLEYLAEQSSYLGISGETTKNGAYIVNKLCSISLAKVARAEKLFDFDDDDAGGMDISDFLEAVTRKKVWDDQVELDSVIHVFEAFFEKNNKELFHYPAKTATIQDLELVARAGKGHYPPHIQKWAEDNLREYYLSGAEENRDHIVTSVAAILRMDWEFSPKPVSVQEAKTILDDRIEGMERVKEVLLDVVADMNRFGCIPKYPIILRGSPGVGKTSIVNAFARCLNRPGFTVDVNTVHDAEAFLGSSRIYKNARVGYFAECLQQVGTDAVFIHWSELDKVTPVMADVLLNFFDGSGIKDQFLGMRLPTQRMIHIGTANTDRLPLALRDRVRMVDLPAYSVEEKERIFLKKVLPRVLANRKLPEDSICFSSGAIAALLGANAEQAGVRELERQAEALLQRALRLGLPEHTLVIGESFVREVLDLPPTFRLEKKSSPGSAMAIAALKRGGFTPIRVEATVETETTRRLFSQGLVMAGVPREAAPTFEIAYNAFFHRSEQNHIPRVTVSLTTPTCALAEIDFENTTLGLAAYMAIGAALYARRIPGTYLFDADISLHGRLQSKHAPEKLSWCHHMGADRLYCGMPSASMPAVPGLEAIQAEDVHAFL